MNVLVLLMLAFLGLAGVAVAAVVNHNTQKKKRERTLALIGGNLSRKTVIKGEEDDNTDPADTTPETISANEIAQKLKKAAREQKAMLDTTSMSSLLMQAGMKVSLLQYWIFSIIGASAFTAILWFSHMPRMVVLLLAFSAYLGFPRFFLRFRANRRQKAFLTDFADALDAMIRLLKAGMPVGEAIAMVAREFSGPVGEEMGRVYDNQKVGVPMQDAVRKMVPRMPLPEVQMFATSIAIQIQTGSSLSEVLGNLSGVIRARYRLKRKIQALSAEAKISAMIIGALPVLVSLALWGVNPEYIGLLFTHPTGKMLLFGAITWMSLGILVMRQMINFRV